MFVVSLAASKIVFPLGAPKIVVTRTAKDPVVAGISE
jgi:hypothetical protein